KTQGRRGWQDASSGTLNGRPSRSCCLGQRAIPGGRPRLPEHVWMRCAGSPGTGAHWRELPDSVGAGNRVFQRENRWAKAGVWERIFQPRSDDPDCEDVLMDSTIVRAHQPRAGANGGREALGRSNGGLPTTLHTAGDAGGNPVRFLLTPGPASEYTQAAPLLTGFPAHQGLADQGDDRQKIVDAGENPAHRPSSRHVHISNTHARVTSRCTPNATASKASSIHSRMTEASPRDPAHAPETSRRSSISPLPSAG